MGPYEILKIVGSVEYEWKLHNELDMIHPVFHGSMLKNCIVNPVSILPLEGSQVNEDLSYEEVPVDILDRKLRI